MRWLLLAGFAVGCADPSSSGHADASSVPTTANLQQPTSEQPNAVQPSALQPTAVQPNGSGPVDALDGSGPSAVGLPTSSSEVPSSSPAEPGATSVDDDGKAGSGGGLGGFTAEGSSGHSAVSGAGQSSGASGGLSEGGPNAGQGQGGAAVENSGGVGGGQTAPEQGRFAEATKPRVLVLTDISNEPDDEESLVRFLVYVNEFDVAGLIATTSTHLRSGTREELIRAQLDAYEEVRPNLLQHAEGFPSAEALREVTLTGQTEYGMADVGAGKASAGSDRIIAAVDDADPRPLWIAGWGGLNTLAQALSDVRDSRTNADLDAFVAKLRVYAISDQDDAGPWLRSEFPNLFYIVSPSDQTADDYYLATWTGISGDEHYQNGPGYRLDLVSNAWLAANVRTDHGPLGELYPEWKYIMEGDTPSYLGLIDNGLGWSLSPSYGGWGGRYALSTPSTEPREIWTNSADTFEYEANTSNTSAQASIWRFRPDFQYDFAARMDWCSSSEFEQVNHNPVPSLQGDRTKRVLLLSAQAGTVIPLSARDTDDPDGDGVSARWYVYPEAGTLTSPASLTVEAGLETEVVLPSDSSGTLHVILDVQDDGTPPLSAYRRIIVEVAP